MVAGWEEGHGGADGTRFVDEVEGGTEEAGEGVGEGLPSLFRSTTFC